MPLSQLLNSSRGESKAELQLVLNAIVEGLCGLDAGGNVTFCNDALLKMTGYRTEEMIGNNLHELLHHSRPDGTKYPAEECAFHNAMKAHQAIHIVGEILWRKDRTCFPTEYWSHPLQQASSLTECVATIQDITEREQTAETLRISEERFRQISNSIDQAFYLVDVTASRLVYVSPAFETITGRCCREASGKPSPWQDLALPEHKERVAAGYRRLLAGEEVKGEYQIRHSNGSIRWVKDHAKPIRGATGGVSMLVGVAEDITEIHQAKDVLRQSEEKFRRILTSIPDVAWTSDRHGRTIYISPKVEAIFGYTKQEICAGGANLWLGRIHAEDFGRVKQAYGALFEKQSAFDQEYRIRRKDDAWIWVHDRATGTREDGGVLYADGILCDITPRKQAEAELQSKTAFLEAQANSTIDGILVVDGGNQRILLNQRLVELFKIPPEIKSNKDDRLLLDYVVSRIKDPEPFLAKINHLNRHPNETSRDEIEFKDGMIFDRYSSPVVDKNGKYYGRIWTFRDITERKQNEDVLQQLSMTVEQSPVSVVITDPQGNISYVNRKFTECTGYSPEEVVGRNPRILNSGRSSPDLYRNLWSTITQGREWRGEFCNKKKNGDVYWEAATIRPITNPKGAITHFLAIKEDITERKRAEEELHGSRQMLQSILDAIPQRVFWKDRSSIYLGCNRAFATDAGLDAPAAIIGKNDFDLAWAGTAELYRADDKLVMEQGSAKLNFHERQSRPDGSVLWLQTNKLPLRDRDGKVTGVIGTYEDITERKRAENELRLTQFSLERASDAVEWIDSQSRIVYVNQAECLSLGHTREELLSLSIPDIDPLFPKEVWGTFWEQLKTRGSMTFETQHQTKQGRRFPVEVTANYLEFDGQEYCFAFARDITERRALESQLRHAQKLEGIGQLAAGIAHEINTPTQFVTDNLTFLRDSWKAIHELLERYRSAIRNAAGTLSPGVAASLDEAERNCDLDFIVAEVPRAIDQGLDGARRVAQIVRVMKEFSHPDSADKTTADLNHNVESTITVARSEWKYVAEIVTEFDETLPPVVCYPGDINQVILNLVVNAAHAIKEKIKDGEKGRITICTRTRGEFAEISVTDTGTGIPEAIRTRIFDPFFTTKEVGKGTGQGLALAHSIVVKKHCGKIWFETEMGRGTTFFIHLPAKPVDPAREN